MYEIWYDFGMENTQLGGDISQDVLVVTHAENNPHQRGKIYKKLGIIVVLCAILATLFFVFSSRKFQEGFADDYTLVPDKISESAAITVKLPDDIAPADFDPAQSLTFSPEIKGTWEVSTPSSEKVYRFLPAQKMTVGAYYLATLNTSELKMEKMFSVDKDPSVLAVFPKQETEVNEYSSITIMFSRPMVALSTLSENADITPPVDITPKTEGRFKWITTRTLQFIPTKRLLRSSTYKVDIKGGLRSLDGVDVPSFTHTFTTRTLNYQSLYADLTHTQTLTHDQPFRLYFNQPFDLEKTRALITLSSVPATLPKLFVAAYGTREVRDEKTGKTQVLTDQSVLEIFPVSDMHGRKYLWDFDEAYTVSISGAVPLEGDVKLSTPLQESIKITPIIESMTAQSKRSNLVTPEIFDPTGTLTFRLSEPVDLRASDISGKGIIKIAYGEKCAEPNVGEEVQVSSENCEKVDDQKSIILTFDAQAFGMKETSSITMKKLVNINGVTLNTSPLVKNFTTFPKFEIVRMTPENSATNGSLTEFRICSTNPLTTPADDEFYKKIRSNMMIGLWNWYGSFFVTQNFNQGVNSCPINTFQTTIRYGLVPNFAYRFTFDLDDHFGQHLTQSIHFTTKDADPLAKGFVHMQPTVVMTPSDRTTFTYGLDFMKEMDMTICKVTPETMLSYRAFPVDVQSGPASLNCLERKTKHIVLPESYATRKYLQVNLKEYYPDTTGNYILVFSNPGYRRVSRVWDSVARTEKLVLGEQLFEKTYVTVTALAVGSKQVERGDFGGWRDGTNDELRNSFMKNKWPTNLYWVNYFKTLTPVFGAVVTPYTKGKDTIINLPSQKTDAEGIAETPSADNIVGAVVTVGTDSAIVSNLSDALSYAPPAGPARREYVYTDRPIYRPGDMVHIKGISRIGYDGVFEVPTGGTKLEIRNAKYEIARTEEVKFNKNGTYEMSFTLDPQASLGYYPISTNTGGYGSFQVEEYVAPQFKIDLSPDKEEYISGEKATINIAANYYFGVPVQGGDVEYRIVSQDYYFDRYQDEYVNFGRSWYDNENGWYGDRFLMSGKMKLTKDGKGVISQELNIDKLFTGNYKNQSKVVTVYVTVKNENGQSITKQQSMIVHRGEFYAGLTMDDYFFAEGKSGTVRMKTVDTKGKPIAKNNLDLTLEKVEWKSYKRQEVDGNFYYRTERVKTKVSSTKIDTDKNGNGSYQFTAGTSGEYEFTISGVDGFGNTVSAQYDFYVSGQSAFDVRPTNNATLELVAEKTDLAVGDIGSFVIKSPYQNAKALVTLARGNTYERKVINIDSQLTQYQFTATEQFIPNVVASVLLLSPLPEIKYGEVYYSVGAKEKELTIAINSSKKKYLPGEEVELDVDVKDSKGNPAQAEVSLSVVDMSVLALVGNPKKHPVTFFYNGEPLTIRTAMNVKNILNVAEIPIGTKGGSGGGGDDLEKKKRGVFRDTAYWNGVVETDANGKAHVKFTLPDNLTEWQVESVGITKNTKVGAGYSDFVARKSIMALPLKPRFILPGDSFAVGGTIFNETDMVQKLNISVTAPTLALSGNTKTTITVEPHTSISVSFPALAPESMNSGNHEFTLVAKNDDYEDVVTSSFPTLRNDTYEFTATAGRITDANWKEQLYLPKNVIADRGALTISMSATMATILDSAIQGMIIYPYECSEQVGSKLRTIAIVKQNARLFGTSTQMLPERITIGSRTFTVDEIVQNGLAKLYQNQTPDGGMSYYVNLQPDFRLTLATLETYIDLKKAGFAVDETKMTQSAQYVFNFINFPHPNHVLSSEDIIASSYVLSRLGDNARWESAAIHARLIASANDKALVHAGLSTPALAYLAIISTKEQFDASATNRLFAEFENRSNIDARGTTVNGSADMPSEFTENAIVNTALALKAFSESKRDTPLLEGYLRAIKTGKAHDGGWASTYNTITVVDAMTEYLKWKNEANAQMSLTVALDTQPLLSAEFTKKNIRMTYATSVPMSMLKKGKGQTVEFVKKNLGLTDDAYYYDMLLRYFLPTASIAPRDEGFSVRRELYKQDDTEFAHPVTEATQGEVLHGRVIISVPRPRSHVTLEDFIPAGVEIVNQNFATEDKSLGIVDEKPFEDYGIKSGLRSGGSWLGPFFQGDTTGPKSDTDGVVGDEMYGNRETTLQPLYPSSVENHDDRIFAYVDQLAPGEYVYDYYLRALIPGVYQYLPLVVSELYTPENFGRTAGSMFTVTKKVE